MDGLSVRLPTIQQLDDQCQFGKSVLGIGMKLFQPCEHFLTGNITYNYMYTARISLVGEMTADDFEVLLLTTKQVANAVSHIWNRKKLAIFYFNRLVLRFLLWP